MFNKIFDLLRNGETSNLTEDYQSQHQTTINESGNEMQNEKRPVNPASGVFDVIVVGVSFCQKALEKICDGRREEGIEGHVQAKIIPYDDNPYDAHAVRIEIEGEIVGHLSRKAALIWRSKMISDGFSGEVSCPAKIAWNRNSFEAGSYGVWLDIDLTLPDSTPERQSASNVLVPTDQSNRIEFLVNELNKFELLNCNVGDEVNLWQKGDSREIFIYRKNHPPGEGKIGVCPDEVCDVLLAAAEWDASIASIYEGGCEIVCKLLSKAEMGKEDDENEADYIEPSKEEVALEMAKWMFVCTKKLNSLQNSDKWFTEETQQEKRWGQPSEFALRWMKPFVSPADFEREEIRALAVNGYSGIMQEFRKIIRQARKERGDYDETLHSLYGLAIAFSLIDDLCNSVPSGYINFVSMNEYVAYRDVEEIEIDYMKIGYGNLDALGKTDIKWLIERFGEPTGHMTTKDIYSEVIANAVTRYIWDRCEHENKIFGKYGVQTIEQSLEEEIKSGFYRRYLISLPPGA